MTTTFFNTFEQKEMTWDPEEQGVYAVRIREGVTDIRFDLGRGAIGLASGHLDGPHSDKIGSHTQIDGARVYFSAIQKKYPQLVGKVELVKCPCLFSAWGDQIVIEGSVA